MINGKIVMQFVIFVIVVLAGGFIGETLLGFTGLGEGEGMLANVITIALPLAVVFWLARRYKSKWI